MSGPKRSDYEAAVLAQKAIDVLNLPVKKINDARTKRNRKLRSNLEAIRPKLPAKVLDKRYSDEKETRMPYKHFVAEFHARILEEESSARMSLSLLSENVWFARLERIEDVRIRGGTACVVWWDFVGCHEVMEAKYRKGAGDLDKLVKASLASQATDYELFVSLMKVGYTETMAYRRVFFSADDQP